MARVPKDTIEFGLQFRSKRFKDAQKGLQALGKSLELGMVHLGPVLAKQLLQMLELVVAAMYRRHGMPWPLGMGPQTLSARSGTAMQSIKDSVKVKGTTIDDIEGEIGGVFYLKVHEYGATIRPKKSKFLTIPLDAALDDKGVPIKSKARDWPNTFVFKSKKGNLIIAQRRGREIVPLYVLKKSVKIPPRLGMRKTLQTAVPYFVDKAMDAMVREMVSKL